LSPLKEVEGENGSLPAQEDYDAIIQSIKDYAGGWFDGDAEPMTRCLHVRKGSSRNL